MRIIKTDENKKKNKKIKILVFKSTSNMVHQILLQQKKIF